MRGAVDVLDELRKAQQPLRISDLAERLEVHPNTVRFHLAGLIERDQVERLETEPIGPGRPAQRYRVVPRMDPRGPRHYRLLAEILLADLVEAPDGWARSVAAGRAWGVRLSSTVGNAKAGEVPEVATSVGDTSVGATSVGDTSAVDTDADPLDGLIEVMADLGFAPEVDDPAGRRIGLRHCPFLELAESGPRLVCGAHLGLMQGVLDAWQAPITADRLEPFVEPDRCLVHLAPRAG